MSGKQKVVVMGLGYVGCVTAAGFAELGHEVLGVDRDLNKVRAVQAGHSPFFEEGLDAAVQRNVEAGEAAGGALTDAELARADVVMLCVGTPSQANGNIDLSHLRRVCSEIAGMLPSGKRRLIITVRSTVYPGTCESLRKTIFSPREDVQFVSNPEFLREGAALRDFIEPSILVMGGSSDAAAQQVAAIYEEVHAKVCLVSLRTAELIKYACNAFHAVKIGFANEIGALAASLGISPDEVMS